jgi:RNA polymerase sigma factor (sigma-70 family)
MSVSEMAGGVPWAARWTPQGILGEARLARLAAGGDRRAFATIFERYHQELYRYCRALVHDPDDAQDALQSTMASALRALPGDERQIALRPWLYRVAHNEAISILRRRTATIDPECLPEAQAPGVHAEAETRERLRDLVVDLDQLPDRQRGALVMRELSGLSYGEVGAALGASEAAARQAVYEARVALKELAVGREMQCESARQAISERDGRVLRGRGLRAHLRACESCRDFRLGISKRRSDLRALCPPLPGVAASGLLAAVLGEAGSAGAGATGGALAGGGAGVAGGTALGGSAAVKGASIAAAVVIGAGAANMTGVAKLPLGGKRDASPAAAHGGRGGSDAAGATAYGDGPAANAARHPRHATAAGRRARVDQRTAGDAAGDGHGSGRPGLGSAAAKPSHAAGGSLPASSNGKPPAHSQAGGAPGGPEESPATTSPGRSPATPPGLANASAHSPLLPAPAQGKPGSPPGRDGAPAPKRPRAPDHPKPGTP